LYRDKVYIIEDVIPKLMEWGEMNQTELISLVFFMTCNNSSLPDNKRKKCNYIMDKFLFLGNYLNELLFTLSLSIVIVMLIPTIIDHTIFSLPIALAQTSPAPSTNNSGITQQWIDKNNNIRIQFNYLPKTPIIDSKTQMKFEVQNLTSGMNIKNFHARVVVSTNSSGQLRTFKFGNITAPTGDFTVSYIFPDSGLYQIITRIDYKGFSALASFKVDVPFQPFGVVSIPGGSPINTTIIAGLVIAVAVVSIIVIMRR
jgi:hypothetical protein